MSALSLHIESTDSMVIMTYSPKAVMIQLQVAVYSTGRELDKRSLVSFLDHFSPWRGKLSGEQPIPFSFHMPECWQANQVALHK